MSRLNRYLLEQFLGPLGFFALVFTGIFWLAQSLRLIDVVISSDQSAWTLAEVSSLILPNVMLFVIPLSAFAATLYTANRLYVESELIVMMTAGHSPWVLMRAALVFGLIAALGTAAVTFYLLPVSATRLADRLLDIRVEFASAIVREGRFVHPAGGVTLYVRDANDDGEMLNIFINDARSPEGPQTYSANRAALVTDGQTSQIVMFDGTVQRRNITAGTSTFETVAFERLAYDLTGFIQANRSRTRSPREYFVHEALNPDPALITPDNTLGRFISEAHDKIAAPFVSLTLPLIALGAVLMGGFRRGGFALRMVLAVGTVIVVQAIAVASKSAIKADPALWPAAYLAPLAALLFGVTYLWGATRTRRRIGARP